jgi:RNA polymerase sigma-70 factor (ECF subfamily)
VSAEPADSPVDAPEALLLRQEAALLFAQALDTLPFYERTALGLLLQQGYSYQDIAARMATPVSTVRTRLWRAGQRLRAHVATGESTPPPQRPARQQLPAV